MNLEEILPKIKDLSLDEQRDLLRLVEQLEESRRLETAKTKFIPFVKEMWPGFIQGHHHEIMAEAFERVMFGDDVNTLKLMEYFFQLQYHHNHLKGMK